MFDFTPAAFIALNVILIDTSSYLRRRFVYLLHGIFIYFRLNIRDALLKKYSVFRKESNQCPS